MANSGHGGFDGGAVVGDTVEKDINLVIANHLSALLRAAGFSVFQTRNDDSSTESDPTATLSARKKSDLQNRLALAEEHPNAILVSIHLNKFSSASCRGAQMFYAPKVPEAEILAEHLRKSAVSLLQPDNYRTVKAGNQSAFLLYYSPIPAVIAECGFISNEQERVLLTDETYQKKMAFAIFNGILTYYTDE